jgi:hypothetical protein
VSKSATAVPVQNTGTAEQEFTMVNLGAVAKRQRATMSHSQPAPASVLQKGNKPDNVQAQRQLPVHPASENVTKKFLA